MPSFHYYGRNTEGKAISGYIDKHDKKAVVDYLLEQKVTPVTIELDKSASTLALILGFNKTRLQRRIRAEQLVMFCRQMHTINKAGVPILQGMQELFKGMKPGMLRNALEDINTRLQGGSNLSQTMKFHPKVFGDLFISMVEVGEKTGKLDTIFLTLAHYIERDRETKQSIQAALRYPLFVLGAMLIALVAINFLVVPAFSNMFNRFEAELPFATHILLVSSNLLVNYWWLILLLSIGSVSSFFYWIKTKAGALAWGRYQLTIPIAGELIRKAALARYARSFAVMLRAGIPLVNAINLCARVVDNPYLSHKINEIKTGVERGDSLLNTHRKSGIFTSLVLQMLSVGEGSGQIDNLLIDVADFYERELEQDIKVLSSRIEPLLILFMAVLVLILALGIFLPMWSVYDVQK